MFETERNRHILEQRTSYYLEREAAELGISLFDYLDSHPGVRREARKKALKDLQAYVMAERGVI